MGNRLGLIFVCSLVWCTAFGQGFSFGIAVGGSNYNGDLTGNNLLNNIKQTKLCGAVIGRYDINPRFAIRATLSYLQVKASDAVSGTESNKIRNLSFASDIYEFGIGAEYNILPFDLYRSKYNWTPYLKLGIAGFHFDPRTNYNGKWVSLQPLGTEGQGTSSRPGVDKYSLYNFNIAFGGGLKFKLSDNYVLFSELIGRQTFTDYLDDVSTSYPNLEVLAKENGPLAAELSNRTGSPQNDGAQRGNADVKDYYFSFTVGVSYYFNPSNSMGNNRVRCPKF